MWQKHLLMTPNRSAPQPQYEIIASYRDLHIGLLAKSRLESEGIPVTLQDENIVSMDWLYSDAIGGVKLTVPSEYAEEALALLEIDTGEAAVETTPIHDIDEEQDRSPRRNTRRTWGATFLLTLYLSALAFLIMLIHSWFFPRD